MRDLIVPGGVTRDVSDEGKRAIRRALANIRQRFPTLVELYDNTASLQDRTSIPARSNPHWPDNMPLAVMWPRFRPRVDAAGPLPYRPRQLLSLRCRVPE